METIGVDIALELRPKSLDEIIGQDHIIPAIKKFIDQQHRNWLFSGPTGVGKTTLSHIVAHEIQGPGCTMPTIQEINAADARGIDAMRGLRQSSWSCPLAGKYGVYIIDEAHRLTQDAKEMLFKLLEVERGPAVWILCTTDPGEIPKPLRDRCSHFQLKAIGARERQVLVSRAVAHLDYKGDVTKFLAALNEKEVVSAREVYRTFEMFCAGLPPRMALGLD